MEALGLETATESEKGIVMETNIPLTATVMEAPVPASLSTVTAAVNLPSILVIRKKPHAKLLTTWQFTVVIL